MLTNTQLLEFCFEKARNETGKPKQRNVSGLHNRMKQLGIDPGSCSARLRSLTKMDPEKLNNNLNLQPKDLLYLQALREYSTFEELIEHVEYDSVEDPFLLLNWNDLSESGRAKVLALASSKALIKAKYDARTSPGYEQKCVCSSEETKLVDGSKQRALSTSPAIGAYYEKATMTMIKELFPDLIAAKTLRMGKYSVAGRQADIALACVNPNDKQIRPTEWKTIGMPLAFARCVVEVKTVMNDQIIRDDAVAELTPSSNKGITSCIIAYDVGNTCTDNRRKSHTEVTKWLSALPINTEAVFVLPSKRIENTDNGYIFRRPFHGCEHFEYVAPTPENNVVKAIHDFIRPLLL